MGGRFHKIAVAISFSPRREALLAEVRRLRELFGAQVLIIHVGKLREHSMNHLEALMEKHHLDGPDCRLVIEQGATVKSITQLCEEEQVDLLVCGAIRRSNLLDIFWSSVAKRLIRSSPCSLLVLARPRTKAHPVKSVVISASQHATRDIGRLWGAGQNEDERIENVIERGMAWSEAEHARTIHIVSEAGASPLVSPGQFLTTRAQDGRGRMALVKKETSRLEQLLQPYRPEGLDVNIKVTAGRPGRELASFARRMRANLLVMQAPLADRLGILWRLACPEFEHVMMDLPCNLLLVR